MEPTWSTGQKTAFAVLTTVPFLIVMWLVAAFVAAPFADWLVAATSSWPTWAIFALAFSGLPIGGFLYWYNYLRHGLR